MTAERWVVVLLALAVCACGWLPTGPRVAHAPDELPALRALAFQRGGGRGLAGLYKCRGCHAVDVPQAVAGR